MKRILILYLILGTSSLGWAQRVVITNVSLNEADIVITYDIFPKSSAEEKYEVEVLSSQDNYNQALQIKSGSNSDLSPGSGLTLTLDGQANFEGYEGELDFQIRGKMTFMPLSFLAPDKISGKRGKTISSTWDGVMNSETYSLQLIRNGSLFSTLDNSVAASSPSWTVPSDHDVGGGYQLKLISNNDRSQSATSPEFSIKRKVPTFVKVLPILGAGAAAYFLILQSSDSNLPGPPDLPESDQN